MAEINEQYGFLIDSHFSRDIMMHPLSQQPIVVPGTARWEHLALEHHQQPPGECTYSLPLHTIRIALKSYHPFQKKSNDGRISSTAVIAGDLTVCPAHSHQWMRWLTDADFLLLFLDPALLASIAEEADVPAETVEFIEFEQEIQDPLILQLGLALQTELFAATGLLSVTYVDALAHALAAHLFKRYCRYSGHRSPDAERLSHTAIRHVVEYIQEHPGLPLTIAELGAIAGMSPYHFSRSFKLSVGFSPHQYILRTRIEQARVQLLKDEESITDLATRLGFADQSHFTRSFKRLVGVTPRAFVLQQRKNVPALRTFMQDTRSIS